jgi:hypothetical protein
MKLPSHCPVLQCLSNNRSLSCMCIQTANSNSLKQNNQFNCRNLNSRKLLILRSPKLSKCAWLQKTRVRMLIKCSLMPQLACESACLPSMRRSLKHRRTCTSTRWLERRLRENIGRLCRNQCWSSLDFCLTKAVLGTTWASRKWRWRASSCSALTGFSAQSRKTRLYLQPASPSQSQERSTCCFGALCNAFLMATLPA